MVLRLLAAFMIGASWVWCFAPYSHSFWFIPIIIIYYLLLSHVGVVTAFTIGLSFGLGRAAFGVSWVHISIANFSAAGNLIALSITAALCLYLAIYPAIHAGVYTMLMRTKHRNRDMLLLLKFCSFGGLWILFEMPLFYIMNGFPWLLSGYAWSDTLLAGWSKLGGVMGVGLVAFTIIALLMFTACQCVQSYQLIREQRSKPRTHLAINWCRPLLALVAIGLLIVGGGALKNHLYWRTLDHQPQTYALIQTNTAQAEKWNPRFAEKIRAGVHDQITAAWDRADLIILPEAALPFYFDQLASFYQYWHQRAHREGKVILGGAITRADSKHFNSMFSLGAESRQRFYHKHILVPFGEYLPFAAILPRQITHLAPFSTTAGADRQMPLPIRGGYAAPLICYEIAYPDHVAKLARRSHVIVTVSNDAWFGDSLGPWQHAQMMQLRAIENESYVLRATSTGITQVVDPWGRIMHRAPQFQQQILYGTFFPVQERVDTPFQRWGSPPVYGVCLLIVLLARRANQHG